MPSSPLRIHHSFDSRPPFTSWQAGDKTPSGSPLLTTGSPARVGVDLRHKE